MQRNNSVNFAKNHQKTPHGVNHEVLWNVDSILLINVLRQLTLSDYTNLVWKYKKEHPERCSL